eukprot:TRINITY_DN3296_c0_g1_i3.p1 TRINITY_DN3296_c0_g1~~TRINITY_DN3296_c0_g1_i3.p1  ORF type:complete len:164 (+),score=27.01 TRINITY_DN3296_c0_g1_i3:26-493(+)
MARFDYRALFQLPFSIPIVQRFLPGPGFLQYNRYVGQRLLLSNRKANTQAPFQLALPANVGSHHGTKFYPLTRPRIPLAHYHSLAFNPANRLTKYSAALARHSSAHVDKWLSLIRRGNMVVDTLILSMLAYMVALVLRRWWLPLTRKHHKRGEKL